MTQTGIGYIDQNARSNWIRLRTLAMVRWFAITGQVSALVVGQQYFGLQLALIPCAVVIGMSILTNVIAVVVFPGSRRLSEAETVLTLLFDTLQLSLLLAFTGGLNNPFALLILAPVTIAATVLPTRSTLMLAGCAIIMITLVGLAHISLRTLDGNILEMPAVFVFGFWVAIVTGILFISIYTRRVTVEMTSMAEALLATQMALAREQKLTDLGGVIAATAHELGTPLATIKLTSSELMEELSENEELRADAYLIREQADRCRDILRSMGSAGKDDIHLHAAPWSAVVREAAEPHLNRGKDVFFEYVGDLGEEPNQPLALRKPEVIHGLRNLIQNAVDFARTEVCVQIGWSETSLTVEISDDGPGFSHQVMNRIGDPFVKQRERNSRQTARPEYDGMGLGLFIAKTLLERSKAILDFSNGGQGLGGAVVFVSCPRSKLEEKKLATGKNQPF
ncbi:MAG: ActS/PrrB/RegB family redox-sensitive histidine kinase, partial [Planktomarina sp.]|nr:ActS/PrrB/RegB family redox-sensitive histidine kinase [Planktomarina sp.]